MTTRNVLTILVLLGIFVLIDLLWLEWHIPLFLARSFVALVEWLSFWR